MRLSNFPPFPGKPPQEKPCLKEQSHFWDVMHQIEIPFVYYLQKIFFISQQPLNAHEPIDLTVCGIIKSVRDEHPLNVDGSIDKIPVISI